MKNLKIIKMSLAYLLLTLALPSLGKLEKSRKPATNKRAESTNLSLINEFLVGKFQIINPQEGGCHNFEMTPSDIQRSLEKNEILSINNDVRAVSINISENIQPSNIENCLYKPIVKVKILKGKTQNVLIITDEMTFSGASCSEKDRKDEYYKKTMIADKKGVHFTLMTYPMDNDQTASKIEKTEDCSWKKVDQFK